MNILDQLAEHARQRVEAAKQTVPLAEAKRQALALPKGDFRFEKALAKPALPSSASAKSIALQGPHAPTSRICKLPKSTKLPVRMPSRCSPNPSGSLAGMPI